MADLNNFGYDFISYILSSDTFSTDFNDTTNLFSAYINIEPGTIIIKPRSTKTVKDKDFYWDITTNIYRYSTYTSQFYLESNTKNGNILQIKDQFDNAKTDYPYIYYSDDTLYLYFPNDPNKTFTYQVNKSNGIVILNINNDKITDTYLTNFFTTTTGYQYLLACCGVGNTTDEDSCNTVCSIIGYYIQNNVPSQACDTYFDKICSNVNNNVNDDDDLDYDTVCGCYKVSDDQFYTRYDELGLKIPKICFNADCRDSLSAYRRSDQRNISCPNTCTAIIDQNVGNYAVKKVSDSTINMKCSSGKTTTETNNTKLQNTKKSKQTNNSSKIWIWFVVIILIIIIFLIIYYFMKNKKN